MSKKNKKHYDCFHNVVKEGDRICQASELYGRVISIDEDGLVMWEDTNTNEIHFTYSNHIKRLEEA